MLPHLPQVAQGNGFFLGGTYVPKVRKGKGNQAPPFPRPCPPSVRSLREKVQAALQRPPVLQCQMPGEAT